LSHLLLEKPLAQSFVSRALPGLVSHLRARPLVLFALIAAMLNFAEIKKIATARTTQSRKFIDLLCVRLSFNQSLP
jgi:hypothetical protein